MLCGVVTQLGHEFICETEKIKNYVNLEFFEHIFTEMYFENNNASDSVQMSLVFS